MKTLIVAGAAFFACSATAMASTVNVAADPDAPTSNFGTPGNTATAGYELTLNDAGGSVNGGIAQTGGQAVAAFANLYFDLNPTVGDGSDLGFELSNGHADAFIPGKNGQQGFMVDLDPSKYTFSSTTDPVTGLINASFSLDNSLFTGPIAGLSYYDGQTFEPNVTLRLSQSLSYSVAGGESYGPDRLGTVTVGSAVGAVPEPATWAMMLLGFGMIGYAMRRRPKIAFAQSSLA